MSDSHSHSPAEAVLGSVCLIAGMALAIAVVAVRLEGLWDLPTSLIRRNPVLMLGLAVTLILGGSKLLWQIREVSDVWRPTHPGQRFHTAVLYSKADCRLCEEAAHVLDAYQPYLPTVETIDISQDAALLSQYGGCVPVVEFDGRRRFTGQINEVLLRRLIEGTPPLPA